MNILKSATLTSISLLAPILSAFAQWGETTNNAVNHLKAFYEMSNVTKILRLEVDINNDGVNDILLSPVQSDDTEDEASWLVYIGKPNGVYLLAGRVTDTGVEPNQGVGFRKDQYKIALIPEIGRYGLLHLGCGRGGQAKCQLKGIVIDGDGFKEIPIGQPVNAETNYDQLAQRFPQTPTPPVQELYP